MILSTQLKDSRVYKIEEQLFPVKLSHNKKQRTIKGINLIRYRSDRFFLSSIIFNH